MPHIVYKGAGNFPTVHRLFKAERFDDKGWIIKLRNCYLSTDAASLIFEATAVRSGFSQDFHLRAERKTTTLTVRLDPYMRIERNEGIHRSIKAVGALLMRHDPALLLDRTNLPPDIMQDTFMKPAVDDSMSD